MAHETLHRFTSLVDQGKFEQAAEDCLADEVYFSSPKFTYKSKSEWLQKFPSFHQKNVSGGGGPTFGPLVAVRDKVYVRDGKAKLFGVQISVKETIEFNDDGKIVSSTMQKA